MISSADTYNGALRETYAWAQTLHDLDVKVFVPETLKKAKDLKVEIKEDSIKVTTLGMKTRTFSVFAFSMNVCSSSPTDFSKSSLRLGLRTQF